MDTTDDLAKKASSSYLYLAFIPVPLIILLIAALHLASPTHPVTRLVFEPPLILPILNTVFLFIVACVVSYIAMRAYLVAGSPTTLLLGCGVLTLGTGALLAGWLIGPGGPNATATVFNVSALVASIFHIIAALVDFTGKRLETDQKRKQRKLVLGYLSVVVFVVILSALSDAGITPPFFVQGKGPTALRQVVLATALILYVISSLYMMNCFIRKQVQFFYWYSLALVLVAINMAGTYLQPAVGSLLGWVSRCSVYLAGIYFLMAVISTSWEARKQKISLDETVAELFRKSEQKLSSILASITDCHFELDKDWRFNRLNDHSQAYFGRKREELIGQSYFEVFPTIKGSVFEEQYNEAVSKSTSVHFDVESILYPGKWVEINAYPTEERGVSVFFRDITEHKQREELIRKNEEKFRAIADYTYDWENWIGSDGKPIWINSGVLRITGYSAEECMAMDTFPLALVYEPDRDEMGKLFKDALHGSSGNDIEFRVCCKDGSTRWVAISWQTIYDEKSANLGHRSSIRDITARKQAEETLNRSLERLAIISDTASQLLMCQTPQVIVEDLCHKVMEHLNCHVFFNFLVDDDRNCLRLNAYVGIPEETARQIHFLDYGIAVCGCAARDACRIVAENIPTTPDVRTDLVRSFGITAYACHPLFAQGQVIGTLSFGTRSRLTFTEEELSLMKTVADQVATAMERMRLLRSSEAKADELELRVQERTAQLSRQADLLDLTHDAIIVNDVDDRITFWSVGAEVTYGFKRAEAEGKIVHKLLRTKFPIPAKDIADIVKREGRWEGELVHTCKEGKEVIVHSRWALRQDEAGRPAEIMEVNRDITLRKRAEEALRMISAYNRSLIEASPDPLVTIDPEGRINDVNPATERVTGYSREMIMGTDFSDYFTDPEKARNGYHLVFQEGTVRDYELEIRHRDGHVTPVLYNASVYRDQAGKAKGVFAAARDISERKRVELALRESEERYRTAIESASDGIALVKEDRHIYVNARFAEMFGYDDPSEIIGKPLSVTVHPDDFEMVSEINRMRQRGEPVPSRYEFKGIKKDGTARFIEVSAAKTSYQGEPVSLAYLRDITEYKNLEAHLRQSQKMEAIGTLAGGIAHDFNNILAAIIGFSEMIEEDLPNDVSMQRHLKRVLNAAGRGRDLVKKILTFSRKTNYERNPLSLFPIIEETAQLLRASLPTTVEIVLDTTATSDTILADPVGLQQIIVNLGTNAALAMREKGGILHISLSEIDLQADSSSIETDMSPGEYVQIEVKDTGTGMSSAVMQRIFEPFFTTREVGEGTGMGLAVVYGIVKSLHGTIKVESELGIGSVFRVFLPKVATEAQPESAKTVEIPKGKERVLFIDDEELLVEWGQALLERLGYEVTALTDSAEAFDIFSSDPSRFDLVITDQTMPHMTGLHLARELLKIRPNIPIILCTGHSDAVTPHTLKEAGVREFMLKPLAKRELSQAVRRVLESKPEA